MKTKYKILIFIICMICLTTITLANNIQNDKITKDSEKIPTETYLISGNKVDILNCSKDDGVLIISGSSVNLTGTYNDDVFVFGNNVYVNGTFNSNLYVVSASSANVESTVKGSLFNFSTNSKISSTIEKDLMSLSAQLNISNTNQINRDLFAFSVNQTDLGGGVARNSNIFSSYINYRGQILGSSNSQADHITYADGAVFEGDVTNKTINKPDTSLAKFKTEPKFIKLEQTNFFTSVSSGTFLTYITSVIIMLLCKIFFPMFLTNAKQNIKANFTKVTILPLPTILFFVIVSFLSAMFSTTIAVAIIAIGVVIFTIAPYIALITLSEYASFKRSKYIMLFLISFIYSLLTSVSYISMYVYIVIYFIGIGIIVYSFLQNKFKSRKINKEIL